jgi:hypothetical protein
MELLLLFLMSGRQYDAPDIAVLSYKDPRSQEMVRCGR